MGPDRRPVPTRRLGLAAACGVAALAALLAVAPAHAAPPAAQFSAPESVRAGQPVGFTDESWDPDGTVEAYLWDFGDGRTSTTPSPVHTYDSAGSYQVRLTVRDNGGETASTARTLHVLAPDAAGGTGPEPEPFTVDAGPDQDAVPGAVVQLSARGPEGASYEWRQVGGARVNLVGATTAQPTFTAPMARPGEVLALTFAVVASKDGHHSPADTVNVTVQMRNRAPLVDAGGLRIVVEGEPVVLEAFANDPDGDRLTLRWSQVAGDPVQLTNATGTRASFTAPPYGAGPELKFRLEATDGHATTVDTAIVLVEPAPRPDAGFTFAPDPRDPMRVTFQATATVGTATWEFGDGSPPATGHTVSHTYAKPGAYEVRLRIVLATGQADEETAPVSVAPLEPKPLASETPMIDSWLAAAIGAGLLVLAIVAAVVARTLGRRRE